MITRSKYFPVNEDKASSLSVEDEPSKEDPQPKPKKARKKHVEEKPEKREDSQSKWEPKNWQVLFENIKKMRSGADAPVDTMGCDRCHDREAPVKEQRFQTLVALMLSSQTRDEVNNAACIRLRNAGLSLDMILSTQTEELEQLIKPVSFYRNKVKYLKRTCEILKKEFDGDIPDSVEGLCSLPGVGPKMAHLVMQVAWDQVTGIAVDTHVHRISNRLKFVPKPTKEPVQTEKDLEDWMPTHLWKDYNTMLVGFGQTICTPINPKCSLCLNKNICPSSTDKDKKAR